MSQNKDIWNTKGNAEAYDAYALEFPMYKETSHDLVEISGIKEGMRVLDLAAGTGVTTQAILDKTKGNVQIIAIDQAAEMLNKAREKFPEENVQFIVAEAEELDQNIHEPVDAVLCNSAFWQMKSRPTLEAVANILKPRGIFAFNLPDTFFAHPSFNKAPVRSTPYTFNDLASRANGAGLELVSEVVKTYAKSAKEIIAFNNIPVMKRNFRTEEEAKVRAERLAKESESNSVNERQWVYLVFRKKGEE